LHTLRLHRDFVVLGTLGFFAGENSYAYAVNNRRDVVGTADTPSGRPHAFLYRAGRMRDIDTLGSPYSVALGINDNGTIVGYYSGSGDHAFRYTDSDGMVPLDTLLPFASFWSLTEARAINSAGQIVGWGYHFGHPSAFLMTPGSTYFQISQEVIDLILAGNIGPITGQELLTDIDQFRAMIQQNEVAGACTVLASFDQTVNQQNGKDIDAKSARLMMEQTEKMGSWLGCRLASQK